MGWQFSLTQQRSLATSTSRTSAVRGQRLAKVKIAFVSLATLTLLSPQTLFTAKAVACHQPQACIAQTQKSALLTPQQQSTLSNLLIGLAYSLPAGVFLGILLYDRYCCYRAAVLQAQIQRLERAWQQSIRP